MIAVKAKRGRLVHATTTGAELAGLTVCNRQCDGWIVATEPVTCPRCLRGSRP